MKEMSFAEKFIITLAVLLASGGFLAFGVALL